MGLLDHAGITDQGRVRFRNEDFIAHEVPADPEVAAAQGLPVRGRRRSRRQQTPATSPAARRRRCWFGPTTGATKSAGQGPARTPSDQANRHVYDLGLRGGRFRMETTVVALALVGTPGAHRPRRRQPPVPRPQSATFAEPLTRDHSEVAELVRMQILRPENARHHPRRHVITRSVGGDLGAVRDPAHRAAGAGRRLRTLHRRPLGAAQRRRDRRPSSPATPPRTPAGC